MRARARTGEGALLQHFRPQAVISHAIAYRTMRADSITADEITCQWSLITIKVPYGQRGILPGY